MTADKRTPLVPGVPTLAEEGIKGFAAVNWWGILFPTGVPKPIIDKVAADFAKSLARADVQEKLGTFGIEAAWAPPAPATSQNRRPLCR